MTAWLKRHGAWFERADEDYPIVFRSFAKALARVLAVHEGLGRARRQCARS